MIYNNKAFSLTELSISLAVIAIIAASTATVVLYDNNNAKISNTQYKLDIIEEALANFVRVYKRLPCPAQGALGISDNNLGLAPTASSVSCSNADFSFEDIYAGVVPVQALDLPIDFMFDGYGRKITYAVDYKFANDSTTNSNCDGVTSPVCFISSEAGSIIIQDAAYNNITEEAVYVLLSHGRNGHGAFLKGGGATRFNALTAGNKWRITGAEDEIENSHLNNGGGNTAYNNIYIDKAYVASDGVTPVYFDDILRYKTKSLIIQEAGKNDNDNDIIIYEDICTGAATLVGSVEPNDCTNADNYNECYAFADQLNLKCLK